MDRPASPKDCWDKSQIVFVALLPVVLAVSGYFINETLKEREARTEYVRVAASILRNPRPDAQVMRSWAIKVLETYSEVSLGDNVKSELEKTALTAPTYLRTEGGEYVTHEKGNRIVVYPAKGK